MAPKYNILLGLTGSVATRLAPKLLKSLSEHGNVKVIMTEAATHFCTHDQLSAVIPSIEVYRDDHEWSIWEGSIRFREYCKAVKLESDVPDELIPHIDLRRWASVFVIAPLSANTLAKAANGLCDNLLTSTLRAWDTNRPIILAPAMNTLMWEHAATQHHLSQFNVWYQNAHVVNPIAKKLACNQIGIGAMAMVDDIVQAMLDSLQWRFPLMNSCVQDWYGRPSTPNNCPGIPIDDHPGAFGVKRNHDIHSGIDLYCSKDSYVTPVESGTVVCIEPFTGPSDDTPWWNDTSCIMVEGASGVVNYGELSPSSNIKLGMTVRVGDVIGKIIPVLPEEKLRSDIPGHSTSMLHIELYKHGVYSPSKIWPHNENPPCSLIDPTPYLLGNIDGPSNTLSVLSTT